MSEEPQVRDVNALGTGAAAGSGVTLLLERHRGGDEGALKELFTTVYDELRRLAGAQMRGERVGHTLHATALVHEAFMRLVDQESAYRNKAHFFAVAATMMRRVLVDSARARRAEKRGGGEIAITLGGVADKVAHQDGDVIRLDEALTALAAEHARPARVIELKYFGGLEIDEIAEAMQISPATVKRDFAFARAWLFRALT